MPGSNAHVTPEPQRDRSPERLCEPAPFTGAMKRPDQQAGMHEAIRPDRHEHEPVIAGDHKGKKTQEENRAAHPER